MVEQLKILGPMASLGNDFLDTQDNGSVFFCIV